jgi:AcrR family transcriptional regulator
MEAASPTRELSGEKAQRIVEAMRTSVGLRGTTGSTFDHVAREAGVSRGLLHYYFGTKERMLAEPDRDYGEALAVALIAARALVLDA